MNIKNDDQLVVGNFYDRSSGRDLDDESNQFLRYTDHGSRGHCLLLPFFYIMHSPFAVAGIGSFAIVLVVCLLLLGAIRFFILPKFYDQVAMAVPDHGSVRRKQKSGQGLSQMLFSYNSQLVRDPNLIMQVLSTSLMTPIILL